MSQQINLYAAHLRPRRELATGKNLGLAGAVLLVLMATSSVWARFDATRKTEVAAGLQKQLVAEQEKVAALTKLMGERKVSPALAAEVENAKAMLSVRQEVMAVLDGDSLGNTTGFAGIMSGFARQAQGDLWLTGFRVSAGGDEIEIRGRMLDPAKLPAYVQRLSAEPVFKGRRFAALEMRSVDPLEEQKAGGTIPAVPAAAGNAEVQGVTSPLPRYVEFALRSENASRGDEAGRGEKQP